MYVIKYSGTAYDSYYQGNYSFNVDIGNWKVKRYKTKLGCEKVFYELINKMAIEEDKRRLSIIWIDN